MFNLLRGIRNEPPPVLVRKSRPEVFPLDEYLPQAVEEQVIAEKAKELRENIKNHFKVFYRIPPLSNSIQIIESRSDSTIEQRGNSPGTSSPAAVIINSPSIARTNSIPTENRLSGSYFDIPTTVGIEQRRKAEVHELLSTAIISAIDPFHRGKSPDFFPGEIHSFLNGLPERDDVEDDQAFQAAFAQWRMLSSYLLSNKVVRRYNQDRHSRRLDCKIADAINKIDKDLEPFIDMSKNVERRQHLEGIMRAAAKLGEILISQAACYEFDWTYLPDAPANETPPVKESQVYRESPRETSHSSTSSRQQRGRTKRSKSNYEPHMVFPALLKKIDGYGMRLSPPICILNGEAVPIKVKQTKKAVEEIAGPPRSPAVRTHYP